MTEVPVEDLKDVIRGFHYGESVWVESVPVHETFQGESIWEGVVQVFALPEYPDADRCFVWSFETDEETKNRRFFVVAQTPEVRTPEDAVRAAIIAEFQADD